MLEAEAQMAGRQWKQTGHGSGGTGKTSLFSVQESLERCLCRRKDFLWCLLFWLPQVSAAACVGPLAAGM